VLLVLLVVGGERMTRRVMVGLAMDMDIKWAAAVVVVVVGRLVGLLLALLPGEGGGIRGISNTTVVAAPAGDVIRDGAARRPTSRLSWTCLPASPWAPTASITRLTLRLGNKYIGWRWRCCTGGREGMKAMPGKKDEG
jgi:hypothetical protein